VGSTAATTPVVADYKWLSAVLGAGRAGHRQASALQYPGIAAARFRSATSTAGRAGPTAPTAAQRQQVHLQQQPPAGGSLRVSTIRSRATGNYDAIGSIHPPSRIRLSRVGLGHPFGTSRWSARGTVAQHHQGRGRVGWALSVDVHGGGQDDCASHRHPRDARSRRRTRAILC
jgi:hypothetical protein